MRLTETAWRPPWRRTVTHDSGTSQGEPGPDRFVSLLEWLISLDGARIEITKVISTDTLHRWREGKYPRHRSPPSIAAVDQWARKTYPDVYPPAWAPGGLASLAGPRRTSAEPGSTTSATGDAPTTVRPPPTGGERPFRLARLTAIPVFVALIAIALFVLSRQNAGSSTLYARGGGSVAIRSCPDLSCAAFSLPTGTKVTMICYRDAQSIDLNYRSSRWFDVRNPSGAVGWVHSSEVANQTRVGLC